MGDRPAQRQLPAGPKRRRPRRDPARAPLPLRRAGQDPRLSGPEGGVLPGRLRTRPRRSSTTSGSTRWNRSRSCARRRRCRCTTASRMTCSPACSTGLAGEQTVVLPRTPEQRSELERRGRLHRPRAGDRRPIAGRVRGRRGVGRRHDESRGGGARDARLHGVRGSAGRRRRAPDRRGPPAAAVPSG